MDTSRHARIADAARRLSALDDDDREMAIALAREIADAVKVALAHDDDDVPF